MTPAAFAYSIARQALQSARAHRFSGDVASRRGAVDVAMARWSRAGQELARARRWRTKARRARAVAAMVGGAS